MTATERPAFAMRGPRAELWANGAPVGTLAHWTLTALNSERFVLEAQAADVAAIANLPPALRPPLEWRIPWSKGGVLTAPVRMIDAQRYAGLAKPVVQRGRVI